MAKQWSRVPWPVPVVVIAALGCGACTSSPSSPAGAQASARGFPVTLDAENGDITIAARPGAIMSLSPTATEILYSIGAGPQVKAVDEYSDYPPQAPRTSIGEVNPSVEQIASYHPDLVVMGPGDTEALNHQLKALGIPVLYQPTATDLTDAYAQFEELGEATGHEDRAVAEVASIKAQIASIVRSTARPVSAPTYYYELEQTFYSVTSATFVGRLLGMLGLKNIADAARGAAGSGGYPQLSAEYIIKANPDYIFLADTICCGQSPATVASRPGWSSINAVRDGHVIGLDDDIASRWGPRMVVLLRTVADALESKTSTTP